MNDEVFAGIKVLLAVARADGYLHPSECVAIGNVLHDEELPGGYTVDLLLASRIDLDVELASIVEPEARRRTYDAACSIAHVDGEVSQGELAVLARVWTGLCGTGPRLTRDDASRFANLVDLDTTRDNALEELPLREPFVSVRIERAAALSAFLSTGALSVEIERSVLTNQISLCRAIGRAYGLDAGNPFWHTFVLNLVGAPAPWFAISSLLALLPGRSSAASAYAATFALGTATALYFQRNEELSPASLRRAYSNARSQGLHVAGAAA